MPERTKKPLKIYVIVFVLCVVAIIVTCCGITPRSPSQLIGRYVSNVPGCHDEIVLKEGGVFIQRVTFPAGQTKSSSGNWKMDDGYDVTLTNMFMLVPDSSCLPQNYQKIDQGFHIQKEYGKLVFNFDPDADYYYERVQ